MRIIFYLGHPAHYHFYIPIIRILEGNNIQIKILIKEKDILSELLNRDNQCYEITSSNEIKKNKINIILNIFQRDLKLFRIAKSFKPDLMVGSISDIAHVGSILKIPSIVPLEDDLAAVPQFDKITSRWASCLVTPESCNVGKWDFKSVKYNGYQELTYLSPNYFKPQEEYIKDIFDLKKQNFLIRFSSLNAYHDQGKTGIRDKIAKKIINILKPHGNIYISSEKDLSSDFEQYRIEINPLLMHHVLYFTDLYIGDSQTMTAEAAILGTPAIRFNDFVGKLGYLEELEHKYELTYGIKTSEPEKLYNTIENIVKKPNIKEKWQKRRQKMLFEKINVTNFFVWLIKEYPESFKIAKENPVYQYKFR